MKFLCALLIVGVASTAAADCPNVTLELKLKKAASGLEIDATLKNRGATSIELMTTGDGSSFGRRNPRLTFTLEPSDVKEVGTCGFINALADEDFLTLGPGQSRKLGWVHPPTPGKPGKYTLRVTYKNDPTAEPLGSGAPRPPTPAQLARIAKLAQCEVTSVPLSFIWDGKHASK
jgi:hypothetical protein